MTLPLLSPPTLFTPSELQSNAALAEKIINLVNEAFTRSRIANPERWVQQAPRFPNIESLHEMLSPDSVMALMFDDSVARDTKEENGTIQSRKVVACAAAVPWNGGWEKEGAGTEEGWEIKVVCVDGDARYLGKGLPVQLLASLEGYLIEKTKKNLLDSTSMDTAIKTKESTGVLSLWILAAECVAGPYWRKRGYQELRRKVYGEGVWACRTSFEMVVLRKEVQLNIDP